MQLLNVPIPGVLELQAKVFEDSRGSFSETFSRRTMAGFGIDLEFCQDNESFSSSSGTVRGLHLQVEPHAQGKLVRVVHGAIFDVAVDIRPDSPTFGQHTSVDLKAGDNRALWIPAGFAHGFCTLADETVVSYKATDFYAPDCERSIWFDDPDLGIDWPVDSADAVLVRQGRSRPVIRRILQGLP